MPAVDFRRYITKINRDLAAGGATERTHYGSLRSLLESVASGVHAPYEQRRIDCGAPDFHVRRGGLLVGYVEAKDVGVSLDEAERSEQVGVRYVPTLANLVLTNFIEFRWYVNGGFRRSAQLGARSSGGRLQAGASAVAEVEALLEDFLAQSPTGAANAKDLALCLARLASQIHGTCLRAFELGMASANMADLYQAMQKALIPDLTPSQFADMFAQTLTYGLFAAWCNHPTGQQFRRLGAAAEIPKTNPLLRQLFETITGTALDDEPFAGYVDDLIQLLDRTDRSEMLRDFGRRTQREDPVVHFYETFLQAYDPKLRQLRGVYYTPKPVVSYIVRSVDHLLRTKFGCPAGLADTAMTTYQRRGTNGVLEDATAPRVLILDPACGTGTFLYEVVDHIRQQFRLRRDRGSWPSYVRQHLLSRIFGFELLMAPYAVAHLKLGMQLAGLDLEEGQSKDWAYDFAGGERLGVFLTNTLEEAAKKAESLFGPLRVIAEEANAASAIKRDEPIMVIMGNPPYSASVSKGAWILQLMEDYKRGLREKKSDLNREEWKFLRFAQWRVEVTGSGIVAFIISNTFLDALTHRRLRESLLEMFTDIYVLDLHGSGKKREACPDGSKDVNVFDIQQGVSIVLLVKQPAEQRGHARVHHAELWGTQAAKYERLSASDVRDTEWEPLEPRSPQFSFLPGKTAGATGYADFHALGDVLPVSQNGTKTDRDSLFIDFDQAELARRMEVFLSPGELTESFVQTHHIENSSSYDLLDRRKATTFDPTSIRRCLYRPFDERWIYYSLGLTSRPAWEVMRHLIAGPNRALLAKRQCKRDPFSYILVTAEMAESCVFESAYANNSVFPLYLYPDDSTGRLSRTQMLEGLRRNARKALDSNAYAQLPAAVSDLFPDEEYPRWPNLHPLFVSDLRDRVAMRFIPDGAGDLRADFGPEDVFDYIYAVLHCPTYRTRYAGFLKWDFPRIPLPPDSGAFDALATRGRDLVALHLLTSPILGGILTPGFPDGGSALVERVEYNANERCVYVNRDRQHFTEVPPDVWGFQVGGHQVCDKWLKDRKGRVLTYDDLLHYRKIIVALSETIRLMAEIDALVPSWPLE
jgi:hypothetical protein